jgi:hypothetical protein
MTTEEMHESKHAEQSQPLGVGSCVADRMGLVLRGMLDEERCTWLRLLMKLDGG